MKRQTRPARFKRQQPQHGDTKGPWEPHTTPDALDEWGTGMRRAGDAPKEQPLSLRQMLKKSKWRGNKEF